MVEIERNGAGEAVEIRHLGATGMALAYDTAHRIIRITYTNFGRKQDVAYSYDSRGRLTKVVKHLSGKIGRTIKVTSEYSYDEADQIQTLKEGNIFMQNQYDDHGRVIRQILTNGKTFEFGYQTDEQGKITQTDVRQPDGTLRRVTFNSNSYTIIDTADLGMPTERAILYGRDPVSNRVTAITVLCRTNSGRGEYRVEATPGEKVETTVDQMSTPCLKRK
ncbi:MAG: RHS repeat protein [Nitrospirae bacterium]|nr:RHS repeat protein [Nitrospirota bacterium]